MRTAPDIADQAAREGFRMTGEELQGFGDFKRGMRFTMGARTPMVSQVSSSRELRWRTREAGETRCLAGRIVMVRP